MLVFHYSPHGISIIRTYSRTPITSGNYRLSRKPEGIGRFHMVQKLHWFWDQNKVSIECYQTLDNTEKREIIGMLDALNGEPVRPITDMKRRWEEIIGPIAVRHLELFSDHEPISPMDR